MRHLFYIYMIINDLRKLPFAVFRVFDHCNTVEEPSFTKCNFVYSLVKTTENAENMTRLAVVSSAGGIGAPRDRRSHRRIVAGLHLGKIAAQGTGSSRHRRPGSRRSRRSRRGIIATPPAGRQPAASRPPSPPRGTAGSSPRLQTDPAGLKFRRCRENDSRQ